MTNEQASIGIYSSDHIRRELKEQPQNVTDEMKAILMFNNLGEVVSNGQIPVEMGIGLARLIINNPSVVFDFTDKEVTGDVSVVAQLLSIRSIPDSVVTAQSNVDNYPDQFKQLDISIIQKVCEGVDKRLNSSPIQLVTSPGDMLFDIEKKVFEYKISRSLLNGQDNQVSNSTNLERVHEFINAYYAMKFIQQMGQYSMSGDINSTIFSTISPEDQVKIGSEVKFYIDNVLQDLTIRDSIESTSDSFDSVKKIVSDLWANYPEYNQDQTKSPISQLPIPPEPDSAMPDFVNKHHEYMDFFNHELETYLKGKTDVE